MIKLISKKITNKLLIKGLIAADDAELYEYAASVLCYLIAPFILITVLIPITGLTYEGFIMIIPFTMLRRYCGGFHFKRSGVCSIVSFFYLLVMEEIGKRIITSTTLIAVSAICLVILLHISFKNTDKYPQYSRNKRNVNTIIIGAFLVIVIIPCFSYSYLYVKWICIGIIMTFALQLPVLFLNLIKSLKMSF